ncbi:MAG: GNAT family N-acetyltransferase [Mollicutes bacterium]|nr:GNAT family N-acetyltransferase [Mollicutes bacterium]
MIIETERFILKLLEKENAFKVFNILSNPKVIENLNMNIHTSIDDSIKLIDDYYEGFSKLEKYPFEILDKKTNDFLGVFSIKLDLFDEDCFEFTIYIDEKYWGRGIYSEVLPYMVKFSFENIKTGNFRGFVMDKNNTSKHVLEKCGFSLEKIFDVDGLDGKIYSYLIKKDDYFRDK